MFYNCILQTAMTRDVSLTFNKFKENQNKDLYPYALYFFIFPNIMINIYEIKVHFF